MHKKAIFMLSILFLVVICSCNKTYNDGDIINVDGIKYQYFKDYSGEYTYIPEFAFQEKDNYQVHSIYFIDMVSALNKYLNNEYYAWNYNDINVSYDDLHDSFNDGTEPFDSSYLRMKDFKFHKPGYYRDFANAHYTPGTYVSNWGYFGEENYKCGLSSIQGGFAPCNLYLLDRYSTSIIDFFKTPGFYVVGHAKDMDVINIPSEVNGYKVKGIGEYAFNNLEKDIEINISKIDSYFNIMPFAINSNNKIVKINSESNLLLLSGAINNAKLELKVDKFSAMDAAINSCQVTTLTNLDNLNLPDYEIIEVANKTDGSLYTPYRYKYEGVEYETTYKGYCLYIGIPVISAIFNNSFITGQKINNKDNLYYYNDNLYAKVEIKDEELSDELYESYVPLMDKKIRFLDLNLLGKYYVFDYNDKVKELVTYTPSFINESFLYYDNAYIRYNGDVLFIDNNLILPIHEFYANEIGTNFKFYKTNINLMEYLFEGNAINVYYVNDVNENKFTIVNDESEFTNILNNI